MKQKRIILVGNPNTGKSTLFNNLCGLKQKTGNFPGVTVDKKVGILKNSAERIEVVDLPGVNSIRATSPDEVLVQDFLLTDFSEKYNDIIFGVVSHTELKKSLYLIDQLRDLNRPMIIVITKGDVGTKNGGKIDKKIIEEYFQVPVLSIARNQKDKVEWNDFFHNSARILANKPIHYITASDKAALETNGVTVTEDFYPDFLRLTLDNKDNQIDEKLRRNLRQNEAILRYKSISELVSKAFKQITLGKNSTRKLDRLLLHPILGYVFFALLMFIIFQAVFWLAAYPMEWIDENFALLSAFSANALPNGYFFDLISQGLIPGIGGVVIFLPQIAILFFLFALMEESGYMQRAVVLSDRIMQKFGMSGKSVIPLISGMACAIPAIMATRTIEDKKERLITILVTPLMTCSARIPVYVILIAIIVPDTNYGPINLQGMVLMGMYVFGTLIALMAAYFLQFVIKTQKQVKYIIDLPQYLMPNFKNVGLQVWDKCKSFLFNAGKIIVVATIILFVLATNGEKEPNSEEVKIENSYLGAIGQAVEPVITPLGYDWKIGIALISSIAAREVFVGTLATIYSIESEDEMAIKDRLITLRKPGTDVAVFSFATCISLLLFYAFALQCISTVAITYKETNSLKWTSIQFVYMLVLAYVSALIAYQLLK